MTMLKLLGGAIVFFLVVIGGTAAAFSEGDVVGTYSFTLQGTVTTAGASGQQTLPTTSVGRFDANGAGQAIVEAVQNLGGVAIINVASPADTPATYSVNAATGIGVLTARVAATAAPEFPLGAAPPGFDFTDAVEYELNFVIVDNNHLELIGTKLSSIDSATGEKTPLGALVASGSASSQKTDTTPSSN